MEDEEEADQLMSEVHLGCPPGFLGPHVSHFTFPVPPTDISERIYSDDIQVEVSLEDSKQMPMFDGDGDLILLRRNADSMENNHAHLSGHLQLEESSNETLHSDKDGDLVLSRRIIDHISERIYSEDIQVEVSLEDSKQMPMFDGDGDLILLRRNADSMENNHAHLSGHLQLEESSNETLHSDKDGDLVLSRRIIDQKGLHCGLTIQHNITSSLTSVGLQVWKAALVLADFILHKAYTSSEFNGITALELGAGTGLVGMTLAPVARTIFLTDIGIEVLDNCATNVQLNSSKLKFHEASVCVRKLNWKESWPPNVGTNESPSKQRSRYSWSPSEIVEAEGATLLLAADVVYSDELTDSFFSILEGLMSRGSEKVLYLALEKRYNFALDDLDVVANGYAHFRSFLKEGNGLDGALLPYFKGEQMDLAQIPQYIREYERGKDLEIWKIMYYSYKF